MELDHRLKRGSPRGALLAAVLLAGLARANGGPTNDVEAAVTGDFSPIQQTQVRLDSEELRLTVDRDGFHYRAEATYHLDNPGPPVTVSYGVPIDWGLMMESDGNAGILAGGRPIELTNPVVLHDVAPHAEALATARQVELTAGGKRLECKVGKGVSFEEKLSGSEWEHSPLSPGDHVGVRGWCSTPLTVPTGTLTVTLRFQGTLAYGDQTFGETALVGYSDRTLDYLLWPAGYWQGPVKTLEIDLDAGDFARDVRVERPAGFRRSGSHFRWTLTDKDLKTTREVRVGLAIGAILGSRDLATHHWLGENRVVSDVSARASGTLPPEGKRHYEPAQMFDASRDTAWCADHGAKEPWIELTWVKHGTGCHLEGFAFIPGYARTAETYLGNNRILKVALSTCAKPGGLADAGRVYELTRQYKLGDDRPLLEDRADLAPVTLWPSPFGYKEEEPVLEGSDDRAQGEPWHRECVRLTVLETVPGKGKAPDTCIGEFMPIYDCG